VNPIAIQCNRLGGAVVAALVLTAGLILQGQTATNAVLAQSDMARNTGFGSRGVRVHDPSTIINCGDEYWIFYTGRGIPSYHSKDLNTWESGPPVFSVHPAWTTELVPGNRWTYYWAPEIVHLDKRYLLYYAVSTFGKNVSAIGLATNVTLNPNDPQYNWVDCGPVIHSSTNDEFNTIDPAIDQDADGKLWMSFGSFWSGIKLVQLDPATGKRLAPDSAIYSLAHNDSIEASYLYRHDPYYYLFVNWGLCCRGTNSTYEIRMGRSKQITGPYLDADGVDMMEDGGSSFLKTTGSFIGPGQVGIFSEGGTNWLSCHFYDGKRRGMSTLAILPLEWNTNGWPEVNARFLK
jgi:arabinan endo-1,5-alpha-L-arabinosidase